MNITVSTMNDSEQSEQARYTTYPTIVPFDETTTNEHNGGTIELCTVERLITFTLLLEAKN